MSTSVLTNGILALLPVPAGVPLGLLLPAEPAPQGLHLVRGDHEDPRPHRDPPQGHHVPERDQEPALWPPRGRAGLPVLVNRFTSTVLILRHGCSARNRDGRLAVWSSPTRWAPGGGRGWPSPPGWCRVPRRACFPCCPATSPSSPEPRGAGPCSRWCCSCWGSPSCSPRSEPSRGCSCPCSGPRWPPASPARWS